MNKLVHNERVKYAVTFFNNLGVAAFAGGAIVPLFSQDPAVKSHQWALLTAGVVLRLFLMSSAYRVLGSLKE
jgi:hypothetical protein